MIPDLRPYSCSITPSTVLSLLHLAGCVDVKSGAIAPSPGQFTPQGTVAAMPVSSGDVAPVDGTFCPAHPSSSGSGSGGGGGGGGGSSSSSDTHEIEERLKSEMEPAIKSFRGEMTEILARAITDDDDDDDNDHDHKEGVGSVFLLVLFSSVFSFISNGHCSYILPCLMSMAALALRGLTELLIPFLDGTHFCYCGVDFHSIDESIEHSYPAVRRSTHRMYVDCR